MCIWLKRQIFRKSLSETNVKIKRELVVLSFALAVLSIEKKFTPGNFKVLQQLHNMN